VTILDAGGRTIRRLCERDFARGPARVVWDGRDDHGALVPAGIFHARIQSAQGGDTHRLVRVR
jgi:flagellar basal-body rod modification protein FlgD